VVRRGLLAGAALSAVAGAFAAARSPALYFGDVREAALQFLLPACGPFSIAFVTPGYSRPAVLGLELVLAPLIALHPVRPHWVTAVVSGLAIAAWFLVGLTGTYTRF
jgi:hypothetical protein